MLSGAVLVQALQQLVKVPAVAVELQPAAAHSFDRAFEHVEAMLASSQRRGHMSAYTAVIIRTALAEANDVRKALKAVARQCRQSPANLSAAAHPTADHIAAAEGMAAALLKVTVSA